MAHVLMYKTDPAIWYQLKSISGSFLFSVQVLYCVVLNNIKTPRRKLYIFSFFYYVPQATLLF
ncbi:MAG TPA: hypothetical protein VEY70_07095 [Metabacillus sp.]|nr:hypothetical protein [Metabacillus sp.]